MGFFLNGDGYEDVAVLSISAFTEDDDPYYLRHFQHTVSAFLNESRRTGKQRLVIDLSANGGGEILAGFELFAQLFPGIDAFNANNLRLSSSLARISRILSTVPAQEQQQAINSSPLVQNLSPLDLAKPQGTRFGGVEDILAPVALQGDRFTAYMRQPEALNFTLTGTGDRASPPPAPFAPENIVLLTDGTCGSTCTIFTYLMIFQVGAKTVAVGGRPSPGPMQSVGGVEGSQVLQLSEIASVAGAAIGADPAQSTGAAGDELAVLAEGYAVQRSLSPTSSPGSVNFKNAFAPSDARTPLQFLYEPASCRFFYTPGMVMWPELVWQYAVNATWSDPESLCVSGSRVEDGSAKKALDPAFRGSGGSGGMTTSHSVSKDEANNNNHSASAAAAVAQMLPSRYALLIAATAAALVTMVWF